MQPVTPFIPRKIEYFNILCMQFNKLDAIYTEESFCRQKHALVGVLLTYSCR